MTALALYALVGLTVALTIGYFTGYAIPRPPVGRMKPADITFMIVALVAMPFAYLHLPVGVVVTIFGLVVLVFAQLTLAPVLGGRWAMLAAAVLCGADVAAYLLGWTPAVLALNDVAVLLLVAGAVNLWAQAAITPAQVAALAAALTVYDTLATGLTSLTIDFVNRLRGLPFAPVLAVSPEALIGLGDCLMLALWPVVALRAYGRQAASWAAALAAALLAVSTATVLLGGGPVPLLTTLGPLIGLQWLFWRRWAARRAVPPSRPDVDAALGAALEPGGQWVALVDGSAVAEGASPGLARRAARLAGFDTAPIVRQQA